MATPFTVVVYGGIRHPVTGDVAAGIRYRLESVLSGEANDLFQFPTTDGREVMLRLGAGTAIAFETEAQPRQ